MSRTTVVLTFVLSVAAALLAQQMTFDLCQLTIHVRQWDGSGVGSGIQIQLLSLSGTLVSAAQTNQDGIAYFQVPSGSGYTARVSGKSIETVTLDFSIFGGQPMHNENVTVRMISTTTDSKVSNSDTISVLEMNVPGKAKEEMHKGIDAFDHGDYAKARQRFEKAVSIYPQYARAYANLGFVALKTGDPSGARDFFTKSITVDGSYLPGYVDLGRIEIQDKQYEKAESLLTKALNLNPSFPEAVALRAGAEYGNKEYGKALADAQRVHTFPEHEKFANTHLLAAQILEIQNRNPEAIEEYQTFLKEDPHSSQAAGVQKAITELETASH